MSEKKINYKKILRGGDNMPTDKKLWAQAKEMAKSKFDVYPSAVANAWASKKYADMGGSWKKMADGGSVDDYMLPTLSMADMNIADRQRRDLGPLVEVPATAGVAAPSAEQSGKDMGMLSKLIGSIDLGGLGGGTAFAAGGEVGSFSALTNAVEGLAGNAFPSPINIDDQINKDSINITPPKTMAEGGYVVTRSNERKGKTHKVTGPDGTVKFFGDPNLKNKPENKEAKTAWYARHAKSLKNNPHFRAYARSTWAEGGYVADENMAEGGEAGSGDDAELPLPIVPDDVAPTTPPAAVTGGGNTVVVVPPSAAPTAPAPAAAPVKTSLDEVTSYVNTLPVSEDTKLETIKFISKDAAKKDAKTLKDEAQKYLMTETDEGPVALLGSDRAASLRSSARSAPTATSGRGPLASVLKAVETSEKLPQGTTPRGEDSYAAYNRIRKEMLSRVNLDAMPPDQRDLVIQDLERKAFDIVSNETKVKPVAVPAVSAVDATAAAAQAAQDKLPPARKGEVVVPPGSPVAEAGKLAAQSGIGLARDATGKVQGVTYAPATTTIETSSGVSAPSTVRESKLSEPLKVAIEQARMGAVEKMPTPMVDKDGNPVLDDSGNAVMEDIESGALATTAFSQYEDIIGDPRIKYSKPVVDQLRLSGEFAALRKAAADAGISTKVEKGQAVSAADRVAIDEIVKGLARPRLPLTPTGTEALAIAREQPEGRAAIEGAAEMERAAALGTALDLEAASRTRELRQAAEDLKLQRQEDFLARKAVVDAQIEAVRRSVFDGSVRLDKLMTTDPFAGKKLAITLGAIANGLGSDVNIEGLIRAKAKAQVDQELQNLDRQRGLLKELVDSGSDLKGAYELAEAFYSSALAGSLERSTYDITDAKAKAAGAAAVAKIKMDNAKKVADLLAQQTDVLYKGYEKALAGAEADVVNTTDLLKSGIAVETARANRAVDWYKARTGRMEQELKQKEFDLKKEEREDPVFMQVLSGQPLRPDQLKSFFAKHPQWSDRTARRLVAVDASGNKVETDLANPNSFSRVARFVYEPGYLLTRGATDREKYRDATSNIQKAMEQVDELDRVYREAGGDWTKVMATPALKARTDQAVTFLRGILTNEAFLNTGVPSGQEREDLTSATPSIELMKLGQYTPEQSNTYRRLLGRAALRTEDSLLFTERAANASEAPAPAASPAKGPTIRTVPE